MNNTLSKPDLVTIPEMSAETNLSCNWFYRRSMINSLPGLRRLGRNLRIDRQVFYDALENGEVE